MMFDILLQAAFILITAFMFLWMQNIPQKAFSKLRERIARPGVQAKRHFVLGAQLLAQARSAKSRSSTASLAESAAEEADRAIALDPRDAASHILKALALDLQGFRTSALGALDVALSPVARKSLSDEERGDALFKRAELKVALSQEGGGGGRVNSAIADLVESVKLRVDNAKAHFVLGECYEKEGMLSEATKAYEEAVRIDPRGSAAQESLARLRQL